jgi:hypothetical protein
MAAARPPTPPPRMTTRIGVGEVVVAFTNRGMAYLPFNLSYNNAA